jgi:leucine dehydrogenase
VTLVDDIEARDFEEVVLCRDPGAGLRSVIAIHDTTLGPALGGIRMRRYASHQAAVRDALDLAEAMTAKAALAGLALGGGKSVIDADPASPGKARIVAAHARYVGALGGRYIPAVDMGTGVADLDVVARHVPVVASERRDPSRFTALGVVRSIEAALRFGGRAGLRGRRVAVQGLGHVGRHVVDLLVAAGAEVLVADVDDARVRAVRDATGRSPCRPTRSCSPTPTSSARAGPAASSPRTWRTGSRRGSWSARRTTCSPGTSSPRCSPGGGSCTCPTSSPTPAG